jgi:hypothetical protein
MDRALTLEARTKRTDTGTTHLKIIDMFLNFIRFSCLFLAHE